MFVYDGYAWRAVWRDLAKVALAALLAMAVVLVCALR